jgi:hypothetical protein
VQCVVRRRRRRRRRSFVRQWHWKDDEIINLYHFIHTLELVEHM